MSRPKIERKIDFTPEVKYFKPRGIPLRNLEEVELIQEEVEALRLKNVLEMNQTECAGKMNISQSTFQRIISSAHKKISCAIIEGSAIKIANK